MAYKLQSTAIVHIFFLFRLTLLLFLLLIAIFVRSFDRFFFFAFAHCFNCEPSTDCHLLWFLFQLHSFDFSRWCLNLMKYPLNVWLLFFFFLICSLLMHQNGANFRNISVKRVCLIVSMHVYVYSFYCHKLLRFYQNIKDVVSHFSSVREIWESHEMK